MGTGVGKERQAGRLLRGSEILLGRWRIMGAGGNLRWMYSFTVFSNYIQLTSIVGYRVCPLSFVIPTTRHVPYPDSEKPSFTYMLSKNFAHIENPAKSAILLPPNVSGT
jgi:hypothetical protein